VNEIMPCGDRTGPWWVQERNLRGRRSFNCGSGWRWQGASITTPVILTKDQQKKMLEEDLKEIELEQQEIKKKLAELEA
jgi:hypothetical protein